jgi:hypothetical protein
MGLLLYEQSILGFIQVARMAIDYDSARLLPERVGEK